MAFTRAMLYFCKSKNMFLRTVEEAVLCFGKEIGWSLDIASSSCAEIFVRSTTRTSIQNHGESLDFLSKGTASLPIA